MTFPGSGPPTASGPPGYPGQPAPPTLAHYVPPAGPGVQPPFAAPPTQRPRTRLWIGIAASLALVLVACIGGIWVLVATSRAAPQQIEGKAEDLVGEFLGDLRDDKFDDAHKLLCTQTSKDISVEELRRQYDNLSAFTVGNAEFNNADPINVPTTEDLGQGSQTFTYQVRIEDTALRICAVKG